MLVIGFAAGAAVLWFLWFPSSIVEWFVASLVPAALAYRLGRVPEGYSPSPAFGAIAGLWAAIFFVPVVVTLAVGLGLIH